MSKKKIDVAQVIKNSDGTPAYEQMKILPEELCKECGQPLTESRPFTLRRALVRCLTIDPINPRTGRPELPDGTIRYQRARLAFRIEDNDVVGLSPEEVVDLKTLAGIILSPVAMARVWDFLDPPEDEDVDTES